MIRIIAVFASLLYLVSSDACAADKPLKVFILAGQSNMVGWGDSLKLPDDLRNGNDRVLMFENDKWQTLRPFKKAMKNQEKFGMTEFSFGPEIAFGYEMSKAWPDETIGIVKFAIGGTSILTWKPDWSKEDADRVGQGRLGSLYKKLMVKVERARKDRDIEIVGFLWVQGGGDMKKVDVAKEYLDNLKSLVVAVRKDTGDPRLPFFCGSSRRTEDPDDISGLEPKRVSGPYPAVEFVLKAQWDVQKAIPHAHTVILRDIEKHPMNVHYNTAGQLEVGKLFAKRFMESHGEVQKAPENCPACAMGLTAEFVFKRLDVNEDKFVTATEFRRSPGMNDEAKAREAVGRLDKTGDGKLSWEELKTAYEARHANCKKPDPGALARNAGELRPDGRGDGNRFAQVFILRSDRNGDGKIDKSEFRGGAGGFQRLDRNKNGFIEVDELGELHQRRLNDPKSMKERLRDGDMKRPPQDKRPDESGDGEKKE